MMAELTHAAFADLEEIDGYEIDDYVTENFGASHATANRRNLFHTFRLLADFPGMGTVRARSRKESVRFLCEAVLDRLRARRTAGDPARLSRGTRSQPPETESRLNKQPKRYGLRPVAARSSC